MSNNQRKTVTDNGTPMSDQASYNMWLGWTHVAEQKRTLQNHLDSMQPAAQMNYERGRKYAIVIRKYTKDVPTWGVDKTFRDVVVEIVQAYRDTTLLDELREEALMFNKSQEEPDGNQRNTDSASETA